MKFLVPLFLLTLASCSSRSTDRPMSNLSSLEIGEFKPIGEALPWTSMSLDIKKAEDALLVKTFNFKKEPIQGSSQADLNFKLVYGRYTFELVYKNADGMVAYESCDKKEVHDIAVPTYKRTIAICRAGTKDPAGETPISPSSNVIIDPQARQGEGSVPSKPVDPSPSIPGSSPIKGHILTGYWQNFNNGAKVLKLADVPTAYNLIAVSFADADPSKPGAVTFTLDSGLATALGGYTEAQFKADIQLLHSQGRRVILSVGGEKGTISVNDATSANNFATSVYTLIQQYGFDGVDIDLENGIHAVSMGSALRKLVALTGTGLILTLAPQTIDMQSTQSGYFQLALAIKDILTIVNMQYYNSGSMNGADGKVYSQGSVDFLTALAAIQLEGGLRPDQVGLGLPASTSGAGSGYVAPATVNAALDCLATGVNCGSYKPGKKYPGIRGAMTWSINWDAVTGYGFANTVAPHFASVP